MGAQEEPEHEKQDPMDYDVAVVGGGVAGVFAALGASMHVDRVLLVEQNAALGGQALFGVAGFAGDIVHVNRPFDDILRALREHHALGPEGPTQGGTAFDGGILMFLLRRRFWPAGWTCSCTRLSRRSPAVVDRSPNSRSSTRVVRSG
jgi:predicted oxidoreductase